MYRVCSCFNSRSRLLNRPLCFIREQAASKQAIRISVAVILALSAAGMQGATAKTQTGLSETDTYALRMAKNACLNQEFGSLLQAMTISDVARIQCRAPEINVMRNGSAISVPSENYKGFPIALTDNNWITAPGCWRGKPIQMPNSIMWRSNSTKADSTSRPWISKWSATTVMDRAATWVRSPGKSAILVC